MRLTDIRVAAIMPPVHGQEEHRDELVVGLRLRVGSGGRKSWIVRTRAGGRVINKTLGPFPTLKVGDARDCARALLRDIAIRGAESPIRTLNELAERWIDQVAKPKNRSWQLQKRRLEMHVIPKWGDRDISTIRRADVRDLLDDLEGEVLPNRVLTIVRTLFRYAMSLDWIEASPAEAIAKPKSERPRDRVLNMEEVLRLYAVADLLGYPFAGFTKMLFLTGQRRSEVASMRWRDIDLNSGIWILEGEDVKSGRRHLVPLLPAAVDILRATPQLGEYVWTDTGRTPISGFAKAKMRLDHYLSAIAGPLRPWRLHDIRRTVATHLVRLGAPELVVTRVLNHAPQGVTARVYALHAYEPEKREALRKWVAEIQRLRLGDV